MKVEPVEPQRISVPARLRERFFAAAFGAAITFSVFSEISSTEHRAGALSGVFLAAYLGLAGPVIGLGALTQIASTRVSLLVFAALLAAGILLAAPSLLGRRGVRAASQPQPNSI